MTILSDLHDEAGVVAADVDGDSKQNCMSVGRALFVAREWFRNAGLEKLREAPLELFKGGESELHFASLPTGSLLLVSSFDASMEHISLILQVTLRRIVTVLLGAFLGESNKL